MDLFQLTRALIDIESITKNELAVGEFLLSHLSALAARHEGRVERYQELPSAPISCSTASSTSQRWTAALMAL